MLPRLTLPAGLVLALVSSVPLLAIQQPAAAPQAGQDAPQSAQPATQPPGSTAAAADSPAAAQRPADPPGGADEQALAEQRARAQQALSDAREKLASYRTLQASIVETVTIGSRPFKATGRYLQGTDDRLRLEFQVSVGNDLSGKLTQVSNGQLLWTRWDIGKTSHISRRDIQEIRKALKDHPDAASTQLMSDLGLGGLKALLAALEDSMKFDSLREAEVDGRKFLVLQGTWKTEFLTKLGLPPDNPNPQLPDEIPDAVRIFLEAESLFPRRIMYLKKHYEQNLVRPLVTLDLVNIQLNPQIEDSEFEYQPPDDVPQTDDTREFIEQAIGISTPPAGQ